MFNNILRPIIPEKFFHQFFDSAYYEKLEKIRKFMFDNLNFV